MPNRETSTDQFSSPSFSHTLMLMQWGQFLDHDITSTPMTRGHNGSVLDCSSCASNGDHDACYPILVPKGDSFFPRRARDGTRKCIPFTRYENQT